MLEMVQFAIRLKEKEAHENAFMQVQHDGVTLPNNHKYQGLGVQFILTDGKVWGEGSAVIENVVLCVAFERSKDNTAKGISRLVNKNLITRCEVALEMKTPDQGLASEAH
jgi:hypothetical protein